VIPHKKPTYFFGGGKKVSKKPFHSCRCSSLEIRWWTIYKGAIRNFENKLIDNENSVSQSYKVVFDDEDEGGTVTW